MGLIYDDPRLAALTLLRIAAEESQGRWEERALSWELRAHPGRDKPSHRTVPDNVWQADTAGLPMI